jgi:arabinan endo-1,5-alpha-L-arabinosidase
MQFVKVLIGLVAIAFGSSALAETPLRDPGPDTGDEAMDLHIHDPSRILALADIEMIAVTGKEQTDGYDCGLELWTRPTGAPGPWRMTDCILKEKPDWVEERVPTNDGAFWAPDFVDENRIIYSVASAFEEGGVGCLGLAVRGGSGAWHDIGQPLSCSDPRAPDAPEVSIIDPAYFVASDGRAFVVTGGGVLHITEADPNATDLGLPSAYPGNGWTRLARGPHVGQDEYDWVEAPHLHEHAGAYYLFVNWGFCCRGSDSTYEIRVGRSESPFGPFRDIEGNDMLNGHGTLVLVGAGALRGPGHASVQSLPQGDSLSFHYYDAERGGLPWIGEVALSWEDGWPEVVAFPSN